VAGARCQPRGGGAPAGNPSAHSADGTGRATAALIALLHALRCEDKIVDPGQYGLSKRELRARAEEVAKGNWASEAVRKAIEDMVAAVVAATTAATVATNAGSA